MAVMHGVSEWRLLGEGAGCQVSDVFSLGQSGTAVNYLSAWWVCNGFALC